MSDGGGTPTVLAFDYGLRRIGVAVGNTLTATAEPLTTITARGGEADWIAIEACLEAWRPGMLVVGVPYNMDGTASGLTGKARAFATDLESRFGLPVTTVDERLSSREAEDALRGRRRSGEMSRRIRRGDIDREAACVLLRQWLEGHAHGHSVMEQRQ